CDFQILAGQDIAGFASALYGSGKVLGLRSGELYWGESHFQEVLRGVIAFRPDTFINLRTSSPPLLHFLMRASLSPLRIHPASDARAPFANILLKPADPPNILRRQLMVPRLWDISDRPVAVKWSRLRASPENLRDAGSLLASKGLDPERTRIFLWQDNLPARQRELLQASRLERGAQGAAKSLVILNGGGSLHATPAAPADLAQSLRILQVESTGLLLGLFARTALTIGMNGPLLHLAGLADADVEGHFTEAESAWDTSFLNPRIKIAYDTGSARSGVGEDGTGSGSARQGL